MTAFWIGASYAALVAIFGPWGLVAGVVHAAILLLFNRH
jgi:hypothetical protein